MKHLSKSTHIIIISTILLVALTDLIWKKQPEALHAQTDTIPDYLAFESGPVRPLAQTPSGNTLVVTNIPDGHLEVFAVDESGNLNHVQSIPVGMEPVAVAARTESEVWVVNHLSDSISIVDLEKGRVVRTLLVGDEPRDIVFGGADRDHAFITTARRGQHRTHSSLDDVPGAGDPKFTTPSLGRADVWVFDANNLGDTIGGTPLKIIELFGDTPRALAVTPDGATVYAAVFNSGNQTAVAPMPVVCTGPDPYQPCDSDDSITSPNGLPNGQIPGGPPPPWENHEGKSAPLASLIVKFNNETGIWEDELDRNWSNAVRFHLPDLDVFAINAETLEQQAQYAHVGTTLFNMTVNPNNGRLYVSNTDAKNEVRFEGSGSNGNSTVQGDLARARVTVIDVAENSVQPRHLNKHIDYSQRPAPAGTKDHSLATPLEMVVSGDGNTLYVTAFGSSKIGVLPTTALEEDSFDPTNLSDNYISISGGGPAGLALNESANRLYVYTRFDNSISVIDTESGTEISHLTMHTPEAENLIAGRELLYDAFNTSSNGEASCAACHIFGDMDHMAWDLGDPDGDVTNNPLEILFEHDAEREAQNYNLNGTNRVRDFHPMKGPMLTQPLRGISNSGAMHWRGDRAVGVFGDSADDERISFKNFIVAFQGLQGDTTLDTDEQRRADMDNFADFALALTYPPNPNKSLDNSFTPSQARGAALFEGPRRLDGAPPSYDQGDLQEGATCQECHRLSPADGFYGTGGQATFEGLTQIVKTAHLRNLYTRIGMFGMPNTWLVVDEDVPGNQYDHMGDQVRGFGFNHDGIYDTIHRFTLGGVFNEGIPGSGFQSDQERRDMEQYILAFESDLAPIVGQQVTLNSTNSAAVGPRIDLLIARAKAAYTSKVLGGDVTECDLVVHGSEGSQGWGMLFNTQTDQFISDRTDEPALTDAELRASVTDQDTEITYTCVPPGSGRRVALDRDMDGVLNRDEVVQPVTPTTMPMPTATPMPTSTPTTTPTAAPTGSPIGDNNLLFVSSNTGGSVGGVTFTDEDILLYDPASDSWSLYFDGSDVGLPSSVDVDAFTFLDEDSILISLQRPLDMSEFGLGTVDDSDLLEFTGDFGIDTTGTWSLYFDGSDVGLTTNSEDIDAVTWTSSGELLISTAGNVRVPGVTARDEDLLRSTLQNVGEETDGTWSLYFDGSDVGLANTPDEDLWGVSLNGANDALYLTTRGTFSVPNITGNGADVSICTLNSSGANTDCTYQAYWDGSSHSFGRERIDALEVYPQTQGLSAIIRDQQSTTGTDEGGTPSDEPLDDEVDLEETRQEAIDDGGEEMENQIFLPFITS